MNIKKTAEHLQRLGQPFDVILVKDGVERQLYTNEQPGEKTEALLHEVMEDWKPDGIIIQEKKRNGSCNRKTERFNLALNGIEEMQPNNVMPQQSNVPSEFKDYLITELKEKNAKLEKKLDKFEVENDELKKANFELEKENRYKDKEFELDKKGIEVERSNGLAGVMETVGSNPALATIAATAIGRLMGIDVPAMGSIEAPDTAAESTEANEGETLQLKVADNIKKWLVTQPDEVASELFALMNLLAVDISKISICTTYLNEMQ
ncbi:hypothetical protein [Saccharicrinis aurantiacus]|uniref:hypothetical protein n=1 Tax=Saccharicrinis aurantiacus TaxID=1849719 RepID=UPI000950109D|nr:hypothetical protein [Saccharicrinis aurantiacus]